MMTTVSGHNMILKSRRKVFTFLISLLQLFTALPWTEGIKSIPISDVQAVEKGTANLPCDISIPEHNKNVHDDVILVLWYREDLQTPIYSVDARDRSFNEAERWSDENVFGNRAYFRSNSRPAILAIENVLDADAAVYRCRVDFRVAQTRNAKVNLTVIARDHNLERAEEMLRNSLAWRKEFRTDSILSEPIPEEFNNYFQCAFGGIDKDGRPIIGTPFGEWDLRNMLDKGRKDEIVRFLAQALEIMDSTMQVLWNNSFPVESLWPHTQFTTVIDLTGFTYGKLMHKKSVEVLLEIIKLYEAHYPETLGKAIVINVSKIAIYDSKEAEWKKAVLEVIDADQIPPRYGGTKTIPPREPIIKDETRAERTLFVGPYTEGSSLTLHCHTDGGNPLPRVVWYRNGKLIDTSDYFEDGVMKNDLTIAILARSDLHAELTCETSNNNISRPLATTVHLDMNFSPLEVTILGKSSRITAGRKYELMCQSVGSRPAAQISWWLDDQRLEGSKETNSKDGNTTTSTLSFIPRKRDSKKYMACRAENSIIPSKVLEDGWNLEIHYLPEAHLKLGSSLSGEHIKEHTDVYFDCVIEANPPVSKVEWRHNNKVLSHNISANVIMTNQSLVLQKVTRLSAGNYTCIGRNSEGEGESQPFYLDVLYSPACRPNQMRVHGVAKMENANISCDVDANPPKVQFRWTFNNSAESIDVPNARYKSVGTRSVVTYTPQTELDYGTLLCWATNKIGDQRVPCVYHIIAAGRPDSVHNCSVANHSTESFFLHCNEGFNGGLPQNFVLELYESQSHKIRANITTSVPVFSVNGLEPGQSFLAHVYAFNNKGRSEVNVIPVFTIRLPEQILTKIEEPRSDQFQLTQTLSILIGVVTALIIVSIAIILLRFYCSRKRSRDRRRREKASTPLKMDAPDGCDSDEKNPDVIPQDSDEVEYYRKRQQHISTIDTSPARVAPGGLSGYCTLRNGGIPLQDLNNIGTRPKFMGPDGYSSGGYAGCPTLPRHHHHGGNSSNSAGGHVTHILDSHVSVNSSGHSTHSLEWPTYQGGAGIGRRQQQHIIIPPPPGPPGERGRLTSFRPNSASPSLGGSGGGGGGGSVSASTQSQSVMTYDMPPLLQIPVLEEEADLTEMPLMSDKIESTV